VDAPPPVNAPRPLGRVGFESGSDIYERARPGYTDDVVSYLVEQLPLDRRSRVLDLAAGTGKMTRLLRTVSPQCVAVEPSPSMRAVFAESVGRGALVAGTAERIPVTTRSMDAVVVAQAFHWFDNQVAVAEIARTLRPEGGLALVWNERDEQDPLIAELVRISKWDRCQPYPVGKDFSTTIDESGLFGPVVRRKFGWVQTVDRATFVDQVASRSYVQVLPDGERATLLDAVADLAATHDEPIAMPYITDVFLAHRRRGVSEPIHRPADQR
jgi:SAM-dependent methyltransferase